MHLEKMFVLEENWNYYLWENELLTRLTYTKNHKFEDNEFQSKISVLIKAMTRWKMKKTISEMRHDDKEMALVADMCSTTENFEMEKFSVNLARFWWSMSLTEGKLTEKMYVNKKWWANSKCREDTWNCSYIEIEKNVNHSKPTLEMYNESGNFICHCLQTAIRFTVYRYNKV